MLRRHCRLRRRSNQWLRDRYQHKPRQLRILRKTLRYSACEFSLSGRRLRSRVLRPRIRQLQRQRARRLRRGYHHKPRQLRRMRCCMQSPECLGSVYWIGMRTSCMHAAIRRLQWFGCGWMRDKPGDKPFKLRHMRKSMRFRECERNVQWWHMHARCLHARLR